MNPFTDEQLLEAATVYAATVMWLSTGPYGPNLSTHRFHLGNASPKEKSDAIKAMRAALHTLGPISTHRPFLVRYMCTHKDCDDSTLELEDDGVWACGPVAYTYCDTCYDEWGDNLEWPCPVAQEHEKENKNAH